MKEIGWLICKGLQQLGHQAGIDCRVLVHCKPSVVASAYRKQCLVATARVLSQDEPGVERLCASGISSKVITQPLTWPVAGRKR